MKALVFKRQEKTIEIWRTWLYALLHYFHFVVFVSLENDLVGSIKKKAIGKLLFFLLFFYAALWFCFPHKASHEIKDISFSFFATTLNGGHHSPFSSSFSIITNNTFFTG